MINEDEPVIHDEKEQLNDVEQVNDIRNGQAIQSDRINEHEPRTS